jgi:hypothetical protein
MYFILPGVERGCSLLNPQIVKNFYSAINVKFVVTELKSCPAVIADGRECELSVLMLQLTKIDLARTGLLRMLLVLLPRKEVIHPHLPVRIPCYDLTPIISPTLGRGKHRRQVLATFMV